MVINHDNLLLLLHSRYGYSWITSDLTMASAVLIRGAPKFIVGRMAGYIFALPLREQNSDSTGNRRFEETGLSPKRDIMSL
jgi:hypothetical protein